jgi:hypothetical protein
VEYQIIFQTIDCAVTGVKQIVCWFVPLTLTILSHFAGTTDQLQILHANTLLLHFEV